MINLIRFIIFVLSLLKYFFFGNKNKINKQFTDVLKILNMKVNIINNNNIDLNQKPFVIISNHYALVDTYVIYSLGIKIKSIAKQDMLKEIGLDLSEEKVDKIADKMGVIPYVRNNIDSGLVVKQKILKEYFINNTSVIVYAEGTSTRNGKPQNFKNGLFRLCADNNMRILPITLRYDRNLGSNRTDKFNYNNIMNANCDLHIHPIQQDNNWIKLKQKVFGYVTSV